jgi:hypothetical protein
MQSALLIPPSVGLLSAAVGASLVVPPGSSELLAADLAELLTFLGSLLLS